jgi:hypothetical protein
MSNQPLRQASSSDQLAAIAYFLDELEHKTPIKALQKETDGNSALLNTINSLVSVVRVVYPQSTALLFRSNWGHARALSLQASKHR